MGERDIDKYFRDELKGYSKEVDTDAIWSALDLDKKKKKRSFYVWGAGLLLFVISTGAYFVFSANSIDQELQTTNKEIVASQNISSEPLSDPEMEILNSSEGNRRNTVVLNSINDSNFNGSDTKNVSEKSTGITQEKSIETVKNTNNKKTINLNINESLSKFKAKEKGLSLIVNKSMSTMLEAESDYKNLFNSSSIGTIQFPNSTASKEMLVTRTLEIKNAQPFIIVERTKPHLEFEEIEIESHTTNRGLSFNIYSGIYNVNRILTTQSMELEEFIVRKEESESPLELISVGAQLRYDIGSVYFKGGIEYQSLNERFDYEQYNIVDTVPTSGVVGIIIDSEGNALNQLGTVYEENTLTTNWTNYNSHRLFNIPLSIGYEKGLKNWFFSIEAQSHLNFRHSFTGRRLDQQGSVTYGSDDLDNSFKLGLGVALGLRYRITESSSIYVSPNYFSYLDSFADESKGYSAKQSLFGLQVGMNFKIF